MNVNMVKQTRTTTSVTWNGTVTDDSGRTVARMSAALDSARPLGNVSCTVMNQTLYEENKEDVQAAYTAFQAQVNQAAAETELSVTATEGERDEEDGGMPDDPA